MKNILVIANIQASVDRISTSFPQEYKITITQNIDNALKVLSKHRYDLIFIDMQVLSEKSRLSGYRDTIRAFKHIYPTIEMVVMTSPDTISEAVKAVKSGINDYITYPINPDEVKLIAESIQERTIVLSELDYLRDEFWETDVLEIVKTNNPAMKKVYEQIRSVAPTKTTVLIYGETGTGKGVLANLIHRHSHREREKFISVHCGAIPDSLLESELFGHEKGAFTGAIKRKLGKFEISKNGSIFLDEIGTITPSAQIKLLQVLQGGNFSRVGGEDVLQANARIIAATNSDLKKMSDEGTFRKDLYYRFSVFPIKVPPLRDRTEDIPLFIEIFMSRLNKTMQKKINTVHPAVIEAMKTYSWPGNIRELENLIERAFILETSPMLTPESFPSELFSDTMQSAVLNVDTRLSLADARRKAIDDFERQFIKEILSRNNGKVNQSAQEAGISTRQFHKLMVRYQIRKEDYKKFG